MKNTNIPSDERTIYKSKRTLITSENWKTESSMNFIDKAGLLY